MKSLTDTVCLKCWQVYVLIVMTGFAVGNIFAKTANALGI